MGTKLDSFISLTGDNFSKGVFEGLILGEEGILSLEKDNLQGRYISPIIDTEEFKELVASWNGNAAENTSMELIFKVRIEGEWSQGFSYGKWSQGHNRGSISNQSQEFAKISIDTIQILGGKAANGIQYELIMERTNLEDPSPTMRNIMATLFLLDQIPPTISSDLNYLVDLDIPARSQMVIPEIGRIICSPTSVAMVMEYLGKTVSTEEAAAMVKDNNAGIYGNWSYNVAYAGSLGFNAYIDRYQSMDQVKEKIAQGQPVVLSIRTTNKEEVEGTPTPFPSGHLLVARGFTEKDGEEYVIVNDPSAPDHDTVRREYKLNQLEKAWRGIVYIIQ